MQEYSKEEFRSVFKKLPSVIQDTVIAPETAEQADLIGTKFNLHIDEKGKLADELGLMLMGLRSPQDFSQALKTKIGVSDDVARQIVGEVNTQIFIPLREKMESEGIKPVSVPRQETPAPAPNATPNVFADEPATQKEVEPIMKEESGSEIPTQIPVETPPAPVEENKIEKKYAIDPYREPIE